VLNSGNFASFAKRVGEAHTRLLRLLCSFLLVAQMVLVFGPLPAFADVSEAKAQEEEAQAEEPQAEEPQAEEPQADEAQAKDATVPDSVDEQESLGAVPEDSEGGVSEPITREPSAVGEDVAEAELVETPAPAPTTAPAPAPSVGTSDEAATVSDTRQNDASPAAVTAQSDSETSLSPLDDPPFQSPMSGEFGSGANILTWSLTTEGVLTVDGKDGLAKLPQYAFRWGYTRALVKLADMDYIKDGSVTIKEIEIGDKVTSIGTSAFDPYTSQEGGFRNVTKVTIGSQVATIGDSAFMGHNNLASIEFPESVTAIGYNTFNGCKTLAEVFLPATIASVGSRAFTGCTALAKAQISRGTLYAADSFPATTELEFYGEEKGTIAGTQIKWEFDDETKTFTLSGEGSFTFNQGQTLLPLYVQRTEILVIKEGVTSLPMMAFSTSSSLTSVSLPSTLTKLETSAFKACSNLTELIIAPESQLDTLGGSVFSNTGLSGILDLSDTQIESLNTTVTSGDFVNTKITEIILPETLTTVGNQAFQLCPKLERIKLPRSVSTIGAGVFNGCTSLKEVLLPATAEVNPKFLWSGGGSAYVSNITVRVYGSPAEIADFEKRTTFEFPSGVKPTIPPSPLPYAPAKDKPLAFELEPDSESVQRFPLPFTDKETGYELTWEAEASKVTNDLKLTGIVSKLGATETMLSAYDISIYDGDEPLSELTNAISVTMPLGTNEYDGKVVTIRGLHGNATELQLVDVGIVKDGAVTFAADRFSIFVVALAKEVVVAFDSRGGSAVVGQTVKAGELVSKPDDPVFAGHTFTGWYLDEACTQAFKFATAITSPVTLFAGWKANDKASDGTSGKDKGSEQGGSGGTNNNTDNNNSSSTNNSNNNSNNNNTGNKGSDKGGSKGGTTSTGTTNTTNTTTAEGQPEAFVDGFTAVGSTGNRATAKTPTKTPTNTSTATNSQSKTDAAAKDGNASATADGASPSTTEVQEAAVPTSAPEDVRPPLADAGFTDDLPVALAGAAVGGLIVALLSVGAFVLYRRRVIPKA
jgi:uncharacterized repeat protein (TIGR02543 family)